MPVGSGGWKKPGHKPKNDSSEPETVTLHRLHRQQKRILLKSRRFNVVCCGRRWGKTLLGTDIAFDWLIEGEPVGWFAPEYKYLVEAWNETHKVLRPLIRNSSWMDKQATLFTEGTIDFWTMDDPDAGRSRKYKCVIVDEAAKRTKSGKNNLLSAWHAAIRPTLMDLRGEAWFLSTPRGFNGFHTMYEWGQDPTKRSWASWTEPTYNNPHIPHDEIEEARASMPEDVFRQEILAQFVEGGGSVFRNVSSSVSERTKSEPAIPGHQYVLGVDLARKEDYTVICVLDTSGRQVHWLRLNQMSWTRQVATILAIAKSYDATIVVDSTGVGEPIYDRLATGDVSHWGYHSTEYVNLPRPIPYYLTHASKMRMIDSLAIALEHGNLNLMNIDIQTNELISYEYISEPGITIRTGAPEGLHDDCVIALGLANWGIQKSASVAVARAERW
ncbi:MAG TPA: terminase family protein [Saprospiraceae bacterium]|nr:terminase family protein [Saprospiraceae bacterium]